MPGLSHTIELAPENRIVHRFQLASPDVCFKLTAKSGSVALRKLAAYRQTAQFALKFYGRPAGERHRGGITFDILGD